MKRQSTMFASGKTAALSECGRYRYRLTRTVAQGCDTINFVMLNPSKADAEVDDPTIKRCIRFARDWGYAELIVTNLFALRSTDPRELLPAADPIGPENDRHILDAAKEAGGIVCAWGARGDLFDRDRAVIRMLHTAGMLLHCIRLTKGGQPEHPLYLPADLSPQLLEVERWLS